MDTYVDWCGHCSPPGLSSTPQQALFDPLLHPGDQPPVWHRPLLSGHLHCTYNSVQCTVPTVQFTALQLQCSELHCSYSAVYCNESTVQFTALHPQCSSLQCTYSAVHCTSPTVQFTPMHLQCSSLQCTYSAVHSIAPTV